MTPPKIWHALGFSLLWVFFALPNTLGQTASAQGGSESTPVSYNCLWLLKKPGETKDHAVTCKCTVLFGLGGDSTECQGKMTIPDSWQCISGFGEGALNCVNAAKLPITWKGAKCNKTYESSGPFSIGVGGISIGGITIKTSCSVSCGPEEEEKEIGHVQDKTTEGECPPQSGQ